MLKIHQLFFINFLGLFVGTLLIASVLSYFTLKSIVVEHSEEDLKQHLLMLEHGLQDDDNLSLLAHDVKQISGMRVTIVNADGLVIAESNADKTEMDNHANRIEIMQAATEPFGITTRYSKTLRTDFLYVAKQTRFRDEPITIRFSKSLEGILRNFYILWSKLALAFSLTVIVALVISYNMSKKVREDIAQITRYLDEISNKNYKAIIKTRHFSEFLHISIMLKNLVKKLSNREKQKRKYTAKLRLLNKQRTDVLSAISHEFKNPVASIMGYAETLQDDPDASPKIREKFLDKIISNGKKISEMLDRLSLSVKLENEDLKIDPSPFELHALCEEVALNLGKKYPKRVIEVEGEPMHVKADKTMLELALINLADNALKYSESDVRICIDGSRLKVIDQGMGIESAELENITSKFYRIQKNTWDNSMGLGLSIVTYILKLHGTSLRIESTYGEGSTFFFDLTPIMGSAPEEPDT